MSKTLNIRLRNAKVYLHAGTKYEGGKVYKLDEAHANELLDKVDEQDEPYFQLARAKDGTPQTLSGAAGRAAEQSARARLRSDAADEDEEAGDEEDADEEDEEEEETSAPAPKAKKATKKAAKKTTKFKGGKAAPSLDNVEGLDGEEDEGSDGTSVEV